VKSLFEQERILIGYKWGNHVEEVVGDNTVLSSVVVQQVDRDLLLWKDRQHLVFFFVVPLKEHGGYSV
jgi:hypothetical protein